MLDCTAQNNAPELNAYCRLAVFCRGGGEGGAGLKKNERNVKRKEILQKYRSRPVVESPI